MWVDRLPEEHGDRPMDTEPHTLPHRQPVSHAGWAGEPQRITETSIPVEPRTPQAGLPCQPRRAGLGLPRDVAHVQPCSRPELRL